MAKSLIEQLPEIVAEGRKEAERILQNLEGPNRLSLLNRELVLPAKSSLNRDLFSQQSAVSSQQSAVSSQQSA